MRLSDLQLKEIINIANGKKIGNIIDITVNDDGSITKLIVEEKLGKKLFAASKEEVSIEWNQIVKIGDDIIIADLSKKM